MKTQGVSSPLSPPPYVNRPPGRLSLGRPRSRHSHTEWDLGWEKVMKHLTAFRCQVVKLFAKHLKIEEQKVMLKKGIFPLGVSDRPIGARAID